MEKALLRIKTAQNVKLVQLNTAVFAYESVLKQLKEIKELSLEENILCWREGKNLPPPSYQLTSDMADLMADLEQDSLHDLRNVLHLSRRTKLDKSQAACFLAGLRQRLSLIQGPPGTQQPVASNEKILIVCYTHHALDQFLEDLLNLGIPASDIVRLGSTKKATARTQTLSLKQARSSVKLSREQYEMLNLRKQEVVEEGETLSDAFASFQQAHFSESEILEHLKFRTDGAPFFDALDVPEENGEYGASWWEGESGRSVLLARSLVPRERRRNIPERVRSEVSRCLGNETQ